LDDQQLLHKGVTNWNQTNASHYNFNEHGQLISEYRVTAKKDTNAIVLVEYDAQNQLASVTSYYTSYGRTNIPSNLSNWTQDKCTYIYKNGLLVAATSNVQSFHKRENTRMTITYDENGRMEQKTMISTEDNLDTLYVNKYKYIGQTDKLKEIKVSHCEKRTSGITVFKYDGDTLLLGKQFTPDTYDLQKEWDSEERFWEYDAAGNCTREVLGDSLKWPVYTYDIFSYNDQNDVSSHTSIVDYDGIGHYKSTMEYTYDKFNNWTINKFRVIIYKNYGYGESGKPDEFYKTERDITYFEE
jgi:hypothetical protein